MLNAILFLCCFLFFSSCISTYTALQNTQPGVSKVKVRNTVGKPLKVSRFDGMDLWTYKFKRQSQEFTRQVFFDSGQVVKIGPLTPYPNYEKKMLDADNLDEYEVNASLYQKQKEKGFREINSLPPNARPFCSSHFGYSLASICGNVIRGNKFQPEALHFCVNKPLGAHKKKLKCLKIVANKKFQPEALNFCLKKLSRFHSEKLKCLKTISNKKFNSSSLSFCKEYAGNADLKLKCLRNLGSSQI